MKTYFLLLLFVIWEIESITGDQSTDPRSNPRVDNALKESSRYHCYYKCHQNPDNCSKDARRDLNTCEKLLYWVYFTNYEVCMNNCNNASCSASCSLYVDCEHACLKIAEDKVRLTSKTPDELIHAYFANMESGKRHYIGD